KALQGFAEDVLGSNSDVVSLFTNHPKVGDIIAFNQALCGLYAAGLGRGTAADAVSEHAATNTNVPAVSSAKSVSLPAESYQPIAVATQAASAPAATNASTST